MTETQRTLLREGIALFNRGEFFDCHELLEELWLESTGERKEFLQGLIQVAVALHHLRNRNRLGAKRLLTAAMEKLEEYGPEEELIDVDALRAALTPLRNQLSAAESPENWTAPQIRWKTFPGVSAE